MEIITNKLLKEINNFLDPLNFDLMYNVDGRLYDELEEKLWTEMWNQMGENWEEHDEPFEDKIPMDLKIKIMSWK